MSEALLHITKVGGSEMGMIEPNSTVYVRHKLEDEAFVLAGGEAFMRRGVQPIFPMANHAEHDTLRWHRHQLAQCDAVVVCWASAGEVWGHQAQELSDWRRLGREKPLTCLTS